MPDHPFQFGATYRVREDFTAERDAFRAGEELVYWRYGSSHHDDMQGWFFRQPGSPHVRSWDLSLGERPEPSFSRLFEQVAPPDPLIAAAAQGSLDTVRASLSPGLTSQRALTVELALERAAAAGHAPVIRQLLALGATDDARKTALMHKAAEAGQAAAVETFLEHGVSVNAEDSAGQTALHHAAAVGAAATVRLLLARGANPHASTRGGSTPLVLARAFRHPAVVALLMGPDDPDSSRE